jgi:CCR4-NOT transcription complex subunit 7/8
MPATPSLNRLASSEEGGIKEVWAENFEEEILRISHLLGKFNKVAMDTEFPGFYKTNSDGTTHDPYELIKANVDILKLIQVGITLSDEKGNMPEGVNTWQFNLKFDIV